MDYTLFTSYDMCDSEVEFNNLIMDYPELKKYNVRFSENDKQTLITIADDKILQFIKSIDEDIIISYNNRKILIVNNGK